MSKKEAWLHVQQIIEEVVYLTVATVTQAGEPWNTPVFCAFDHRYDFFWGSHQGSQHSTNIRHNGEVFLTIYDSTAPAGTGSGVYIQGQAEELTDPTEIAQAYRLLSARDPALYWSLDEVQPGSPVRLYRARPRQLWLNTESQVNGLYIDDRIEITNLFLSWRAGE